MNATCDAGEVIDRLKMVVGSKSDRELSLRLGYSTTGMTNKRARGSVPFEEAVAVALERDISLDWLILGRGEPPPGLGEPPPMVGVTRPGELQQEVSEFVSVPLYDLQAAAGNGRLFSEERVKYTLHFRREWVNQEGLYESNLVALEVTGDSMDGTLQEGDTVLINRAATEGDGVFLLRLGEALRIKRLQRLADGSLRLSSDNEFYAPEVVHPEQLGNVEIIGHCHWRGGRVY
ncbi:MAG: LexA family transcriptional regulator [Ectothiorhodospiraceae bacterium]|nr:LexA family transcriptional regulator [Ectothiorhodospiraceae bacterium]